MRRKLPAFLSFAVVTVLLGVLWGVLAAQSAQYSPRTEEEYAAHFERWKEGMQRAGDPTTFDYVTSMLIYVVFTGAVFLPIVLVYEGIKLGLQRLFLAPREALPNTPLQQPSGAVGFRSPPP